MDTEIKQELKLSKAMSRFKIAMERIYPGTIFDYTISEPGKFANHDTQRHWLLYCTGKQDQNWYQPYAHIIARVTKDGLQIARKARGIRHTKGLKFAIDGLIRNHGGEYVSLSIAAFDVDRLRRAFGLSDISDLNEISVTVVDHHEPVKTPAKSE